MTNNEAKVLVNSSLKKYKLQRTNEVFKGVVLPSLLMVGVSNLCVPLISSFNPVAVDSVVYHSTVTAVGIINAIICTRMTYTSNKDLKERINTLKKLKYELEKNVNRFESVNIEDFDKELEKIR